MRLLHSVKSYLSYLRYPLKSFSDKEPFKDYKIELKNEYFSVYQPKTEKIIAADGNVVCTQLVYRKDILFLYPDINKPNRKFKVLFNSKFFPDLISCSRIQFVLLLPYIPKTDNRTPKWRLVVITDKCQVYHNFPENVSGRNGMITFKESFIWDLPGNKYPSKNVNCEEYEYYNPYLPESAYEYHPAGNSPSYVRESSFRQPSGNRPCCIQAPCAFPLRQPQSVRYSPTCLHYSNYKVKSCISQL